MAAKKIWEAGSMILLIIGVFVGVFCGVIIMALCADVDKWHKRKCPRCGNPIVGRMCEWCGMILGGE